MEVPFLDLKSQYNSIEDEINETLQQVFKKCAFAGGPFVESFENALAQFCGCRYAIGVGSGTEALFLSLLSLGIGFGDEVITVPNTFIATAEAISMCGAKPVFIDIDEFLYNMDSLLLESAITENTKAIIPVHLYGQMAKMDSIMNIAAKYGLYVIEDACQALGSEYLGQKAGTFGTAGCFSFYPGKNLGAYGEAGAIVTNKEEVAQTVRYLRDHGQLQKNHHVSIGWNARMDGIQGAILEVKLKHLNTWNQDRQHHAALYTKSLSNSNEEIILPVEDPASNHIYHIYSIRLKNRDMVLDSLKQKGIHCGIHYPKPIHLQPAYEKLHFTKGYFPRAELCAAMQLSLPMYPELTDEAIHYVVDSLKACLQK